MKWFNVELPKDKAESFIEYLRNVGIYFEPSEAYNLVHFECLMDENEADTVNEFLYKLYNGITC